MGDVARILVVDDDPALVDALSRLLKGAGHDVLTASTGADCLKIAHETEPDLILLDVVLPDMNGFDACRRIKAEHGLNGIFVVLISSLKKESQNQATGLEAGADGYIVRPLPNREFLARVDAMVRIIQTEKALAETNQLLETVFAHTHMLVAYLDPHFNFIRVNRAYAEADEKKPSFFVGKNHFHLFPNEENEKIFRRVVETGKPHFSYAKPFEYAEHPERGESYWDWGLVPIADSEGEVTGLVLTLLDVTERLRAAQALKLSEERYAVAQRAANIGSWDWDIENGALHWSDRIEPMFGFGDGEFGATYEAFLESVHPEDRERVVAAVDACIENDDEYSIEHRVVWPDGTVRWVQETGDVLRNSEGKAARMVGVVRDITQRKGAMDALIESEEKFRNLAEQSPNMIFINQAGRIVYANPRCEEVMGYTREELYSSSFDFLCLIAPEDFDLVKDNFARHMTGQEVPPYEYGLVTKTGKQLDAIITPKLIKYEEGHAILGIVTDITQRRQAEAELRRLSRVVEQSPSTVVIVDPEGNIEYVNRKFTEVTGYAAKDVLGKNPRILKSGELGFEFYERLWSTIQMGHEWRGEFINRKKNGEHYRELATIAPIRNAEGEITHYVKLAEDITERVRAEEALRESEERYRRLLELSFDGIAIHRGNKLAMINAAGAKLLGADDPEQLVGMPLVALPHHDHGGAVRERHKQVAYTSAAPLAEEKLIRLDGSDLDVEVTAIATQYQGEPAVQVVFRDITERVEAERALRRAKEAAEASRQEEEARRQEAEERRRIAEGLADVVAILNSNQSLDEVLDFIAVQAGQLLENQAVAIYSLQSEQTALTMEAAQGLPIGYVAGADIPIGYGALRESIQIRQPVAVSDIPSTFRDDEELAQDAYQRALFDYWADIYQALLAVPIVIKDEIYGGILLYYAKPREFMEDEVDLAMVFANQAALAIENARLRDQVQEAAATAERSRLARELHDAVTQTLFSASLIAEAMPRVWEHDQEAGRQGMEELRQLTRGAAAEMRTMLLELRPAALTEKPLGESLRHLTEAATGRSRVPIGLAVEGDSSLPPRVQIALYRIAQEALNNIAKHAGASQVEVTLRSQPGRVMLGVSDNGSGFDPQDIRPDQMGLAIMKERAESIDAHLSVTSELGCGTEIVVSWLPGRGRSLDA
jgi:PAS domain S-box-containing protein